MRRPFVRPEVLQWLFALCVFVASFGASSADDTAGVEAEQAWAALADGRAVAIMRHALAPGGGDPAAFDPDDCSTQRNLSDAGRDQAGRIGDALRERLAMPADAPVQAYTSAWCRCRETAELLGLGDVERLPSLDSFFRDRDSGPVQTEALRGWIANRLEAPGAAPAVLVTHQVNVTALTGVFPASGQLVIVNATGEPMLSVQLAPI